MSRSSRQDSEPAKARKPERLEIIRRMLLAGVPEWKIRRQLFEGFELPAIPAHVVDGFRVPASPAVFVQASKSTITKDFQDLASQFRGMHDDPDVAERVVGARLACLIRIAGAAEAEGKYHAAIRANEVVINLVSRRHTRWSRKGEEEAPPESAAGGVDDYEGMSDEELQAKLAEKRARAEELGLKVHAGGGGE